MKELTVKYVPGINEEIQVEKISHLLDTFERNPLAYSPWPEFPFKPKVSFSIAHSNTSIFLKFFVEEKHIRAINIQSNSPVYEDSCVEFFVSFDEGINYYNFEFNCIGTGLVGYGSSKDNRQLLDARLVNNLEKQSNITSENDNGFNWQLTIVIPLSIFIHTTLPTLSDTNSRANFYKCGDLLPEPHFISWSNIVSETPNFHLPRFFGKLVFE